MIVTCAVRAKKNANAGFADYRYGLILLGLAHGMYTIVFKVSLKNGVRGDTHWMSMFSRVISHKDF